MAPASAQHTEDEEFTSFVNELARNPDRWEGYPCSCVRLAEWLSGDRPIRPNADASGVTRVPLVRVGGRCLRRDGLGRIFFRGLPRTRAGFAARGRSEPSPRSFVAVAEWIADGPCPAQSPWAVNGSPCRLASPTPPAASSTTSPKWSLIPTQLRPYAGPRSPVVVAAGKVSPEHTPVSYRRRQYPRP
jgi:hypothetical protein